MNYKWKEKQRPMQKNRNPLRFHDRNHLLFLLKDALPSLRDRKPFKL